MEETRFKILKAEIKQELISLKQLTQEFVEFF